jgi:hypothetical protein
VACREFRFGVSLIASESRAEWQDKARTAESLGYDIILVPDHLGMPAPFPSLVAAAQITTRPRLGTLVLNAGFYMPALLARDVASTDQLVNGRWPSRGSESGIWPTFRDRVGPDAVCRCRFLDHPPVIMSPCDDHNAVAVLLPHLTDVVIEQIDLVGGSVQIWAHPRAMRACCPGVRW